MDLRLVLIVVPFVLVVAMFGVRRYRLRNIVWGTGSYALFVTLVALAPGRSANETVWLIGLAFAAGAVAQHANEDEKQREKERRAAVGLTV